MGSHICCGSFSPSMAKPAELRFDFVASDNFWPYGVNGGAVLAFSPKPVSPHIPVKSCGSSFRWSILYLIRSARWASTLWRRTAGSQPGPGGISVLSCAQPVAENASRTVNVNVTPINTFRIFSLHSAGDKIDPSYLGSVFEDES